MGAKRFLSGDAPRLPLPSCGAPTCNCRYVHHGDRRDAEEGRVDAPQGVADGRSARGQAERREEGRRTSPSDGWLYLAR